MGSTQRLIHRIPEASTPDYNGRGVKQSTHHHVAPMSRMILLHLQFLIHRYDLQRGMFALTFRVI
jgi:hypothetical protein